MRLPQDTRGAAGNVHTGGRGGNGFTEGGGLAVGGIREVHGKCYEYIFPENQMRLTSTRPGEAGIESCRENGESGFGVGCDILTRKRTGQN